MPMHFADMYRTCLKTLWRWFLVSALLISQSAGIHAQSIDTSGSGGVSLPDGQLSKGVAVVQPGEQLAGGNLVT